MLKMKLPIYHTTKKIIPLMFILLVLLGTAEAAEYHFKLNLSNENGTLKFNNLTLQLDGQIREQQGIYKTKIELLNYTTVDGPYFDTFYFIIVEGVDPITGDLISERKTVNKTEIILDLPYYENIDSVRIYNPLDRIILYIPVAQFAKNLCGDGICQGYESEDKCPADCAKEVLEEKEEVKETITQQIAKSVSNNYNYIIIAIAAIVLIIIITRFLKKRQKSQIEPKIPY